MSRISFKFPRPQWVKPCCVLQVTPHSMRTHWWGRMGRLWITTTRCSFQTKWNSRQKLAQLSWDFWQTGKDDAKVILYHLSLSHLSNRIFGVNWVNSMPADALAPYVAGSSEVMILTLNICRILSIFRADFHLPTLDWCWKMIEKVKTYFVCLKWLYR